MATVTKDFRIKSGLVVEGTNGTINGSDIITEDAITGGTQTNITVTYNPSTKVVDFVAENGIADSTTDDLAEGEDNLYFTNQRAIDAVGGSATPDNTPNTVVKRDAQGDFAAGEIAAQSIVVTGSSTLAEVKLDLGGGAPPGITEYPVIYSAMGSVYDSTPTVDAFEFRVQNTLFAKKTNDGSSIDIRTDILQDSAGNGGSDVYLGDNSTADNLIATAGDIDAHSDLTTGVHGVSGDVVGTTDTQDLSNKRIIDTLHFTDGVTIANEGEIAVKPTTHEFEVKANFGNLDLKTIAASADVNITATQGDIVLNANGDSYLVSATAGNEIATQGNVADAVDTHSDLTTGVHGVSGDVVGTSDAQTLTNKTMGDDLLMDGNQISGLPMPDQADHAASKAYVDSVSEGLHIHASAVAATTTNINISNDLGVGDIIDGVTLAATNRVLVKDQTTAAHNGIYVVQTTGSAIRATDFDAPAEVDGGDFIFVTGGNTQADTGWVQTSEGVVTIGLDPINFTQFSGAGTFLAGNGLILDGNTFEIDETITATRTFASGEAATAETNAKAYTDDLIGDATVDGTAGDTVTDRIASAVGTAVSDLTDAIEGYLDPSTGTTIEYIDDQDAATLLAANGYSDALVAAGDATATPTYLALDINDVAKQVAASVGPVGATQTVAYAFAKADYRSAKFLVKVAYSTHTEISEVLLTLDTSDNIAITEYAVVGTNGSSSAISAGISESNVQLLVTPVNASSTIRVYGTLLA